MAWVTRTVFYTQAQVVGMGKRKKISFNDESQVRVVTRVDGTPNKGGRPVGSKTTGMPDHRRTKQGLVEAFNKSNAPGILAACLNLQLPAVLRPQNREALTIDEDAYFRKLIWKNFQWAAEFIAKLVPRELGRHGQVVGEMSLADLTRRATTSPKSPQVIELVKQRRADEVEQYVSDELGDNDE